MPVAHGDVGVIVGLGLPPIDSPTLDGERVDLCVAVTGKELHPPVPGVTHGHRAVAVNCNTDGFVELPGCASCCSPLVEVRAVVVGYHDPFVAGIGDVHVALCVNRDSARAKESQRVGLVACFSAVSHTRNSAIAEVLRAAAPALQPFTLGRELDYARIPRVRHKNIAVGVNGDATGFVELTGTIPTGANGLAYCAVVVENDNLMGVAVGYDHCAVLAHCNTTGCHEFAIPEASCGNEFVGHAIRRARCAGAPACNVASYPHFHGTTIDAQICGKLTVHQVAPSLLPVARIKRPNDRC